MGWYGDHHQDLNLPSRSIDCLIGLYVNVQVGQDAFESTAGTLSTHELTGHTDSVASLAFNSKGTLLATGGMEGRARTYREGRDLEGREGAT